MTTKKTTKAVSTDSPKTGDVGYIPAVAVLLAVSTGALDLLRKNLISNKKLSAPDLIGGSFCIF